MITKPLAKLATITTGLAALGTAASILLGTMRDTYITVSMNYTANTTGPIMEIDSNTNISVESDQYFTTIRTMRLQYLIAEIAAGNNTLENILPWQPDQASVILSGSTHTS